MQHAGEVLECIVQDVGIDGEYAPSWHRAPTVTQLPWRSAATAPAPTPRPADIGQRQRGSQLVTRPQSYSTIDSLLHTYWSLASLNS